MNDATTRLEATFSIYIAFGAIIMAVNAPMVVYIYSHKHLRKQKEVVIIGFVCIADLVNAIAFTSGGIYRLQMVQAGKDSLMWTNLDCGKTLFAYVFIASYQLIGASILSITIDRVIAVTKPFFYRSLTWRYGYTVLGVGISYVTMGTLVCLYFWFKAPVYTVSAMCFTSTAYTPYIWNYMLYFRQCSIALSIVMYLPIAIRVVFLRRKALNTRSITARRNPHRRLTRTTILIGITLLCEIVFVAIPDFFLNFNLFGWAKYEIMWYLIVHSKGIVNIFLYLFKHEDIKAAVIYHLSGIRTVFLLVPSEQRRDSDKQIATHHQSNSNTIHPETKELDTPNRSISGICIRWMKRTNSNLGTEKN